MTRNYERCLPLVPDTAEDRTLFDMATVLLEFGMPHFESVRVSGREWQPLATLWGASGRLAACPAGDIAAEIGRSDEPPLYGALLLDAYSRTSADIAEAAALEGRLADMYGEGDRTVVETCVVVLADAHHHTAVVTLPYMVTDVGMLWDIDAIGYGETDERYAPAIAEMLAMRREAHEVGA